MNCSNKLLNVVESKKDTSLTIINNVYINNFYSPTIIINYQNTRHTGQDLNSISCTNQSKIISLKDWKKEFLINDYSKDYRKQILAKLPLIFKKDSYNVDEFINVICDSYRVINKNDRSIKLVRLVLNYCDDKQLLTPLQLTSCRKKLKNKPVCMDNHVPTDTEVKSTLKSLNKYQQLLYLTYLYSGIRKVEGYYLLKNLSELRVQRFDGFVKISMNYLRKNKNSYFCYLPLKIYDDLIKNYNNFSLGSLESTLKRKKLISIKYCRKWFYTKCIELGIPESIADYYQGRVANSVGSNHYLSRQLLADKNYNKIVSICDSLS
jgi:intergrase/recombinase